MEYSLAGYEKDKLDKAGTNLFLYFFIDEQMAMYEYSYLIQKKC